MRQRGLKSSRLCSISRVSAPRSLARSPPITSTRVSPRRGSSSRAAPSAPRTTTSRLPAGEFRQVWSPPWTSSRPGRSERRPQPASPGSRRPIFKRSRGSAPSLARLPALCVARWKRRSRFPAGRRQSRSASPPICCAGVRTCAVPSASSPPRRRGSVLQRPLCSPRSRSAAISTRMRRASEI